MKLIPALLAGPLTALHLCAQPAVLDPTPLLLTFPELSLEGLPLAVPRLTLAAAPIKDGEETTDYPELIDLNVQREDGTRFAKCTGVVIAPRVVLTCGHCLAGRQVFSVRAINVKNKMLVHSKQAVTYDWKEGDDPRKTKDHHDVGLVILPEGKALELDLYPAIAKDKRPDGTKAIGIGRVRNKHIYTGHYFRSKVFTIADGKAIGYPLTYSHTPDQFEDGDSGCPIVEGGCAKHTILGVDSDEDGKGNGTIARIDLLHDWIVKQVEANGGFGKKD